MGAIVPRARGRGVVESEGRMAGATVARVAKVEYAGAHLYDASGAVLIQHRLSPDPRHYAFAFRVLSEPQGVVAQSGAAMTECGIRLSSRDIASLGGANGA